MRIVYIAEDGALFNNEFECRDYEFRASLKDCNRIYCYDKDGESFTDLLSDDAYNYGDIIIIETEKALKTLHKIADYCGWSEWETIDSIGTWEFKELGFDSKFVKTKEIS